MAAYIVFTREKMRDPAEYEVYKQKAGPASAGHAMTLHAFYGRHEVLEGAAVEGVAIIEFSTFVEAKAYYDSPAYREAREHRFQGADYRAMIVEGSHRDRPAGGAGRRALGFRTRRPSMLAVDGG